MSRRYKVLVTVMLAVALLAASLTGCAPKAGLNDKLQEVEQKQAEAQVEATEEEVVTEKNQQVEITMENGGTILIEMDAEAAPITVENFLKLVGEGFYDGLTFHRVTPDFMIQGGDPDGIGTGGSDEAIKGEFAANGWENPLSHKRGVISMARSQDPDSASSQFFITVADVADMLDDQYAAFGRVLEGMEVVDEIVAVERDEYDMPLEDVIIKSIRIVE